MSLTYSQLNTPEWWARYFASGDWELNGGSMQTIDHMIETLALMTERKLPIKNKKVLDIGCALGEGTEMLSVQGAQATGADFVEDCLVIARKRYPDLRFCRWDIREIPEHFDTIIANHILEHMGHDVESTLRHLKDHCDILVVQVPSFRDYDVDNAHNHHTGLLASALGRYPPQTRTKHIAIWS